MHHSNLANVMLACIFLVSCAPNSGGGSPWNNYDYSRSAKTKAPADYDADYALPTGAGVCMDDSPGCY
jgi:hypothetical protein